MKKQIEDDIVNGNGNRKLNKRNGFSRSLQKIVAQQEANALRREQKAKFEKRSVDSVFWWHMFDMLVLGGPFAAIVVKGIWGGIPEDQFLKWTGVAMVFWVIAFVRQQRRFGRFKCHECDRTLWPDLEEDKPIIFRCHECKIAYDIGFRHSTD